MRAHRFRPNFDRLDARLVLSDILPASSMPGSEIDLTAVVNTPDPSAGDPMNPTLDPWDFYGATAPLGTPDATATPQLCS